MNIKNYTDIRAWPFIEAQRLLANIPISDIKKTVIFETGYGPSGLPHIGTFGEVARTLMVQNAFKEITENKIPSKLICFSDDMDALRKVPENIPNQDEVALHLGKPLTQVPDPFEKFDSFGAHNNNKLRSFLDKFDFEYEFISSTEYYKSGHFNDTLIEVLKKHDKIKSIVKPILGEERSLNYSPILPICPHTGKVLQVAINCVSPGNNTITYNNPNTNKEEELDILNGNAKLQWRADWAMRWKALAVDYEMSGKDLIDSVKLSSKICKIIGGVPPEGFNYELFLDINGEKISKSRGNGISIEEWLKYASQESLSLFMYQSPKKAKRLYFDIIPKNMDEYNAHLKNFLLLEANDPKKYENPIWHIHNGKAPLNSNTIQYSLLLNLVSASNSSNKDILRGFIKNYYDKENLSQDNQIIENLLSYAITYFNDFVKPHKVYRMANGKEKDALVELSKSLIKYKNETDPEIIQSEVYRIGKEYNFDPLREWFSGIYQILFGQKDGPRFGSFIVIYGIENTQKLINSALQGDLVKKK